MSIYLPWQTATITTTTSTTVSDAVNLQNNCEFMQVILPALTSCSVSVHVCDTSGGTYVALGNGVATGTTTGSYSTTFKLGGYQYIKIVTSAAQGVNRSIKVRGFKL